MADPYTKYWQTQGLSSAPPTKQETPTKLMGGSVSQAQPEDTRGLGSGNKRGTVASPQHDKDTAVVSKRRRWKERGTAESRDTRGYDRGNTKDALFGSGNARQVPQGLRRAAGGDGGQEGDGIDGEGGTGDGNESGNESDDDDETPEDAPPSTSKAAGKQAAETGPDEMEYLRSMANIQMKFGRHEQACELQRQLIALSPVDETLTTYTAKMVGEWRDLKEYGYAQQLQDQLLRRKERATLRTMKLKLKRDIKLLKTIKDINQRVSILTERASALRREKGSLAPPNEYERRLLSSLLSTDSENIQSEYLSPALWHLSRYGDAQQLHQELEASVGDENQRICLMLRFARTMEVDKGGVVFKLELEKQLFSSLKKKDVRTIATTERAEAWYYLRQHQPVFNRGGSFFSLCSPFCWETLYAIDWRIWCNMATAWREQGIVQEADAIEAWLYRDLIRDVTWGNEEISLIRSPDRRAAFIHLCRHGYSDQIRNAVQLPVEPDAWWASCADEKQVTQAKEKKALLLRNCEEVLRWLRDNSGEYDKDTHGLAMVDGLFVIDTSEERVLAAIDLSLELFRHDGFKEEEYDATDADNTSWLIDLSETQEPAQTTQTAHQAQGNAALLSFLDTPIVEDEDMDECHTPPNAPINADTRREAWPLSHGLMLL